MAANWFAIIFGLGFVMSFGYWCTDFLVHEDRRQRLLETAHRLGLGAVLLGLPANFAHYTGGADNRVDHSQPLGVAAVLVTPEAEYVVADNIEAPRMREEETPGFEVVEHPWYENPAPLLRELAGGAYPVGGLPSGGYPGRLGGGRALALRAERGCRRDLPADRDRDLGGDGGGGRVRIA